MKNDNISNGLLILIVFMALVMFATLSYNIQQIEDKLVEVQNELEIVDNVARATLGNALQIRNFIGYFDLQSYIDISE